MLADGLALLCLPEELEMAAVWWVGSLQDVHNWLLLFMIIIMLVMINNIIMTRILQELLMMNSTWLESAWKL